jgi:hypothetical protein
MDRNDARPETPEDGNERRDPSATDLVHAVVDVAMGHPNARNRRRALIYLGSVVVGPLLMHWGLNLQAKANEPDPAAITAKLAAHDEQLKAIGTELTATRSDVHTMAGNVDTLTRFVIGDRPMPATVRPAAPPASAGNP